jgi:hypothetical protein
LRPTNGQGRRAADAMMDLKTSPFEESTHCRRYEGRVAITTDVAMI